METYTNGFKPNVLDYISLFAIICGILVIINKNPIISVLFLIGLFGNISCYLLTLGLCFIGLAYLIVYIGAVSILFLFILMLINIRISELHSNTSNSLFLSVIILIYFNYPLLKILPYNINVLDNFSLKITSLIKSKSDLYTYNNIEYVTSKFWDGNLLENSHMSSIGNIMYSSYNIWLILASLILLLAMVGAIIITIKNTSN